MQLGLFNQITLEQCPGLAVLLDGGEKVEDLMKLSPEAILLRWVNHQLERAGAPRRIHNFTNDISDSEAYTHLLYQIAPLELGMYKMYCFIFNILYLLHQLLEVRLKSR